jgi:hypothetical protein
MDHQRKHRADRSSGPVGDYLGLGPSHASVWSTTPRPHPFDWTVVIGHIE